MIQVRVDARGVPEAVRDLRIAGRRIPAALRRGLKDAAAPVADGVRQAAAGVSIKTGRIPGAVQVRVGLRNTVVQIDPKAAPEAKPLNHGDRGGTFRHPVWADPGKTRSEWTWVAQQAQPFFRRGAEHGIPEADRRLAQVFTEWERQAGFH